MATRTSEHEKILRVHEVFGLLLRSYTTADIEDYCEQKWGVGRTAASNYIKEARIKLKDNIRVDEDEMIAQQISIIQGMVRDELKGGEEGVSTNNRLAALQMIRSQLQILQLLK